MQSPFPLHTSVSLLRIPKHVVSSHWDPKYSPSRHSQVSGALHLPRPWPEQTLMSSAAMPKHEGTAQLSELLDQPSLQTHWSTSTQTPFPLQTFSSVLGTPWQRNWWHLSPEYFSVSHLDEEKERQVQLTHPFINLIMKYHPSTYDTSIRINADSIPRAHVWIVLHQTVAIEQLALASIVANLALAPIVGHTPLETRRWSESEKRVGELMNTNGKRVREGAKINNSHTCHAVPKSKPSYQKRGHRSTGLYGRCGPELNERHWNLGRMGKGSSR